MVMVRSLVVNAGSSSIKFQVFNDEESILSGLCEEIGNENSLIKIKQDDNKEVFNVSLPNHKVAFEKVIEILRERGLVDGLTKVIHRTVHGGEKFMDTTIVDDEILGELRKLIPLAPLHNPANIEGIELMKSLLPDVPQVAVFDTAYHSSMPEEAYLYGVPYSWYKEHGVRRYGFHGSSHQYVVGEALRLLGKENAKIINCHLGNGASVCATIAGKSVDTSMGMTPLEGNIMGTRCGNVDPGVILHMLNEKGMNVEEVDRALNKESGLKGLSEITNDMRPLEQNMNSCEASKRAVNVYLYRLVQIIGGYIASMEGVDAVVFTGGAGENSSMIRRKVAEKLKFLGVDFNEEANSNNEEVVTNEGSKVKMFVIPTNEELQMVRNAKKLFE